MSERLTLEELEKFMWQSTDIFKEESVKLIADRESEKVVWEVPDCHQFFVPKRASPIPRY